MKAKQTKMISQGEGEEPHHSLYEAIGVIKTSEEAKAFFTDLCTPAELQALTDRWLVVHPLKKGKPYRKIYDETGVSVTTVTRVARFINHGSEGYNTIYDRLNRQKNAKKTKNSNTKKGEVK